uniref:Sigma-70 family RNA polymerase sigma factor n=1 Tax=Roseihalotalea indica TaxID=2867963 RepID=A0AA49GNQ9_9BACT|nr:sigma-70 family RNA polymerase sigma factor [Tunicatimonas sp. TK19036]
MLSRFLHVDDTRTWDAFRTGNQAAFEYIYQTHFQALYRYGRKFSKDTALIGDTLQQLFTDLWQKRKKLGPTDHIKNYLYVAFRRSLLRNQKKRAEPALQPDTALFGISLSHEAQIIEQQHNQEQRETIQRALDQLTEKQREAIYLKFYDELSYAEISEIMGVSAAQVYDFVYKALRSLRRHLKKSGTQDILTSSTITFFIICYYIFPFL